MFNINPWEMVVLVVVFLIVFGPERVPEAAVHLGRLMRELRKVTESATSDLTREIEAAAKEAREAEKELHRAAVETHTALQDAAAAAEEGAQPAPPSPDVERPKETDR